MPAENEKRTRGLKKKQHYFKNISRRGGYIIILITVTVLTLTISAVLLVFTAAMNEYKTASHEANYTRARFLAQSALEGAIMAVKTIPADQLRVYPIFFSPPPLPLGGGTFTWTMTNQAGKLNVNRLVRFSDDQEDEKHREYFDRLAESMKLSSEMWDAVIDWIDENNAKMARGFERVDYQLLNPPRQIKNWRIHSINELLMIPGFDNNILYTDLRTEEMKEQEESEDFLTDEELAAISDEDYILANNITHYLPADPNNPESDRININEAPYHVVLSLSEFMTEAVAKRIIIERLERGYFGSTSELNEIPELQVTTVSPLTLFKEIEPRITTSFNLYKIVATASFGEQTAKVEGVFDQQARKLTYYME